MPRTEHQIQTIVFTDEGAVIQYMTVPTDVRVKGAVVMQHQVQLDARHPDYREDIADLHDRAQRALRNALEDFETSEPWDPREDDEDDDMRGMGDPV